MQSPYIGKKRQTFWQTVFHFEADWLSARLCGCRRILSIGCGTGVTEALLAEQGLAVVGLDPDSELLAQRPAGIDVVMGRGESLPFGPAAFEAVIAVASLQFMEDTLGVLAQTAFVLPEGGRMILMLLNPASPFVSQRMADPNSYFSRMRHPDPAVIQRQAEAYFHLDLRYALGVDADDLLVSESDPKRSLLCILEGARKESGDT